MTLSAKERWKDPERFINIVGLLGYKCLYVCLNERGQSVYVVTYNEPTNEEVNEICKN